jgi:hypothetical protein
MDITDDGTVISKKVNVTIEQAMKAQRNRSRSRSTGIALLFL